MGYDRGDSFPFDFEPNGIPFGSKCKGKLFPFNFLNQLKIHLVQKIEREAVTMIMSHSM